MSSPKPHQGFMQLSPFLPPPLQTAFHLLSLIVLSCLSFPPVVQTALQAGRFGEGCPRAVRRAGGAAALKWSRRASSPARIGPCVPPRCCWIITALTEPRQARPTHTHRLLLRAGRETSAEHPLGSWRGKDGGGFGMDAGMCHSLRE